MDLKDFIINGLLAALFITCIFTFIFGMTNANKPIIGLDTSGMDLAGLNSSLNDAQGQATDQMGAFTSENPVLAVAGLVLFSVWGVIKLVISSVLILVNIIFGGIGSILGVPPIVIGVITAVLMISMIFAAWKVIKWGK